MEETQNLNEDKHRPELKLRAGSVALTIWNNKARTNTGENAEYKTITLTRAYKTKDGDWKNTNSFRMSDVPKAIMLLTRAYEEALIREA